MEYILYWFVVVQDGGQLDGFWMSHDHLVAIAIRAGAGSCLISVSFSLSLSLPSCTHTASNHVTLTCAYVMFI